MHGFNELPSDGFLRLPQIIGTKERPGPVPVSRATFYKMVADGIAPRPIKLGARAVAWRAADIRALVDRLGEGERDE